MESQDSAHSSFSKAQNSNHEADISQTATSQQNGNSNNTKQDKDATTQTPLSSRGEPKGPPQACLFVASLSPDTTEETLHDYFSRFGQVLKIKLMKDRSSRPYAFIQFQGIDEANKALQYTNSILLDGRRLRVEKAKVNRTLFIAKMSRNLNNQKLREIVEAYGPVESVTIIKNHQTQKSRGCGFVKFVYREDAMDSFLGLKNQNRKWVVEWATSVNDPDMLGVDKYNIFVGGLNPLLITKELMEERFGAYGPIESITLINHDDITTEGDVPPRSAFAFVRYKDPSSSVSAIEQENGAEWLDRRIRVQYCESPEMKNKRRTQKYLASINNVYTNQQYYGGAVSYPPMVMVGNVPMYMNTPSVNGQSGKPPFAPYSPRLSKAGISVTGPVAINPQVGGVGNASNMGMNVGAQPYNSNAGLAPPADIQTTTYYPAPMAAYSYNPMVAYNQPWLYTPMPHQTMPMAGMEMGGQPMQHGTSGPSAVQQDNPILPPHHLNQMDVPPHMGVIDDSASNGAIAQLSGSFVGMSLNDEPRYI